MTKSSSESYLIASVNYRIKMVRDMTKSSSESRLTAFINYGIKAVDDYD
jgi:hypothetical protein